MTNARPLTPASDAYSTHKRYWADSGDDIQIPIDPFQIATRMGIRVYTAILGPNQSGKLDKAPDGSPVIYLNEAHARTRQRFTCAHEIGHYVDALSSGTFNGGYDRDELAAAGTDPQEIYANRFAAALLMPKDMVRKYVDEGMTSQDMARRFKVSMASMDWRLRNLNLRPKW